MSSERFRVRVTKDHLVFSAGHFITIETPGGQICERLHGHNWRVAVEVAGPLDRNHYVFDFIALRDNLQKIVDGLKAQQERMGSDFSFSQLLLDKAAKGEKFGR